MKTLIGVTIEVEGFHRYPNAPEEVAFLRDSHRHLFKITCKKEVKELDREIEFILLKRKIENHLKATHGNPCQFGSRSCEMICQDLIKMFDLDYVCTSEDGENFAEVWK